MKIRLFCKIIQVITLFVIGLIITGLVFPALAFLCQANSAKRKRDRLKVAWYSWFNRVINLQITYEGKPVDNATFVVSNHVSWLDIAILGGFFPACFVAKIDILGWPVIGYLAREAGTIFIKRGDKKQILVTAEKMVWLIKQGCTVIAFPEGTTTKGDDVLNFHASLFQPAVLTKTSVQPVAISYVGAAKTGAPFIGDDEFLPHLIKVLSMEKIEAHIAFLPTVQPVGKNRNTISYEAKELLLASLTKNNHQDIFRVSQS